MSYTKYLEHKQRRVVELKQQLEHLSLDLICALGEHNQDSYFVKDIGNKMNAVITELQQIEAEVY